MKTIFGIGSCGTKIATLFKEAGKYKVITANTKKADIILPDPALFEDQGKYEDAIGAIKIKKWFKKKQEVLCIVGGGTESSSSTLALLEQIREYPIDIVYIIPDHSIISRKANMLNVAIGNILQEYTRSGCFRNIYLISNKQIDAILGGIPVGEYYDKINEMIVYLFKSLDTMKETKCVFSSFQEYPVGVRIHTLGLLDLVNNYQEQDMFEMTEVSDIVYYFALNKDQIKTDKTLLKKLNSVFTTKLVSKTRVSYGVYETELNTNYSIYKKSTSIVQKIQKE